MPSVMMSRRSKIALSVVGILLVLLVVAVKLSGTYVDYLWFGEVGQRGVYSTVLWTRVVLFLVFGTLMAAIIATSLVVAYKIRPPFRPMSPEQQNLQNYVLLVEPRRKLVLAGVVVISFFAAGASAQGDWATWQTFFNGQDFGVTDPQFRLDVGFYAWDYPLYRLLLSFGFTAIIFSLLMSIGIHYLTGAIRLQTPGPKITLAARRHLTVLVFVFMLLKAAAYWLDRYGFVFSDRSKFTGANYTDVHAALPAKTILFWITIILAIGVLASLWLRSTLLPGIGFVVLLVLSILMGGIYPAIVQSVSVNPNASTKERPYIERNIEATRAAYGIVTNRGGKSDGTVTYRNFEASSAPNPSALKSDNATVSNLRILDPNVVGPTFQAQQAQQRNFYGFPAKLDVDRYTVNGSNDDYIVGVRELSKNRLTGDQTNWINQYTNYTHGWGFVAARANANIQGTGDYADGNIPTTGALNKAVQLKVPQVYFGELTSEYAIVGAKGSPREFDGKGTRKITYDGKGGISLGNPVTKLAFALNEKETNFLLNDAVGADGARALINRDPRERVKKVAPFLKVDGDPYPILDRQTGHIVWMVDAYTTISNYPYSERQSLSDLTDDSLTRTSKTKGQADTEANYIRNSVKATVDAYDGTVKLYQWDAKDPVLNTWKKVFPGLISKNSDMPESIREHVRYPEDLFEVQRGLLEQYHVDDPTTFYNQSDKWTIPTDPAAKSGDQPPYYVLADPENTTSSEPQFQLTTPMKVNKKTNLAAYITVNSDPERYGEMTVLKVPTDRVIQGPEYIQNDFQNDQAITEFRTNASRGGSTVIRGNLLTLPIGKSFLFVQPMYVQSEDNGFPLLRKVQVSYGGKVGFGDTVDEALDDLRNGRKAGTTSSLNGTDSGGSSTPSTSPSSTPSSSSGTPSGSTSGSGGGGLQSLLGQLDRAQSELNDAYESKDPQRIADAQARRDQLVQRVLQANSSARSNSPSGSSPSR